MWFTKGGGDKITRSEVIDELCSKMENSSKRVDAGRQIIEGMYFVKVESPHNDSNSANMQT